MSGSTHAPAARRGHQGRGPGPSTTRSTTRTMSRRGDASEREADRAADVVTRGGSVAGWSFSALPMSDDGRVHRDEKEDKKQKGKEQTEQAKKLEEKHQKQQEGEYKEGAKKTAGALLDTKTGKEIKQKVLDSEPVRAVKKAAGTTGGKIGLGVAGAGALAGLVVAGKKSPDIPLGLVSPKLEGWSFSVEGKGPAGSPNFVGLTITFKPKRAKKAEESEHDKRFRKALETDRMLRKATRDSAEEDMVNRQLLEWHRRRYQFVVPVGPGETPDLVPYGPAPKKGSEADSGDAGSSEGSKDEGAKEAEKPKKKEDEAPVQRELAHDGAADRPAADAARVDDAVATGGRPLDAGTRRFMESRFGVDFSSVRLHDDTRANAAAGALDARAFTVGHDIVVDHQSLDHRTPEGRHLLAHELAHVVQQSNAAPGVQPLQRRSVGEWIGIFLGTREGSWTDKELTTYLDGITKSKDIEDDFDSDNKARAIVRRWKAGSTTFKLSVAQKVLLIREMLDGPTLIEDETAIVDLLVGSPESELKALVGPSGAPMKKVLKDVDNKAQRQKLDAWLEGTFKGGRKAVVSGKVEVVHPDKDFTALAEEGELSAKDAPERIQIPKEVTDALEEAWKTSFPKGKAKEQGGLMVRKKDGSLEWIKATDTTSSSTTLPWHLAPKGSEAVVAAHTHPYDYDETEGSRKGVTFSDADLANLVTQAVRVKVVHAGDRYFAVARTTDFDDLAGDADDPDQLKQEMKDTYDAAFEATSGYLTKKVFAAAKATCRKYGLALYEGKLTGLVVKVDLGK